MRHEKIIKDERGTTGIVIKFWSDSNFNMCDKDGNYFRYDVSVWNTPPKKRNQNWQLLSFVTPDEIQDAKMELWSKIKP